MIERDTEFFPELVQEYTREAVELAAREFTEFLPTVVSSIWNGSNGRAIETRIKLMHSLYGECEFYTIIRRRTVVLNSREELVAQLMNNYRRILHGYTSSKGQQFNGAVYEDCEDLE